MSPCAQVQTTAELGNCWDDDLEKEQHEGQIMGPFREKNCWDPFVTCSGEASHKVATGGGEGRRKEREEEGSSVSSSFWFDCDPEASSRITDGSYKTMLSELSAF